MADGLYDRVLGTDDHDAPRPEPPICVDLRGPSGSIPSAGIVVENTRLQPADVICTASEFAPRTGGARFRPALEIIPARFSLAPGEHRDVDIRLPLDSRRFAIATDYVATLAHFRRRSSGSLSRSLIARAKKPWSAAKARDAAPEHGTSTSCGGDPVARVTCQPQTLRPAVTQPAT